MPNVVPGALWHPIDVGQRAARTKGRGLVGHVAVSNNTLLVPGPLATRPSDWHFYLPKQPYPTGEKFAQLIDLNLQSWSNYDGNSSLAAFESQGGVGADVNGPWTENQLESAAIILAHLHATEGVPLQDMGNSLPTSRGFGVHRYGVDPYRISGGEKWSTVYAKTCPGDQRFAQRGDVIARAQQKVNGTGGVLMALSDAEQQELLDRARGMSAAIDWWIVRDDRGPNSKGELAKRIEGIHVLVTTLASKTPAIDPAQLAAAIHDAMGSEFATQVVDEIKARL